MRRLYSLLLYLLVPWVLLRLARLGLRNRGYWQRWRERFGRVPARAGSAALVWVHAVSVGEVQAARPLVDGLQRRFPKLEVLVTTTTPTGAAMVARAFGAGVQHLYFPYDLPGAVHRFLDRVHPGLLVLVETELWPNLLGACAERGVPVALVNARMSARSCAGYRLAGRLVRRSLDLLQLVAAQSAADAERLIALGARAPVVTVTGSVKFDMRTPASVREQAEPLRRSLGIDRPVLVAASTHPGEEAIVLEAFVQVRARFPAALLILVPRHPERGPRVLEQCRAEGLRVVARSAGADVAGADVLVGDTLGELALFYAAGDVAFVGGSLVPVGGHNVLEPAAAGLPILTGPHVFNFAAVTEPLTACGALVFVDGAAALAARVSGYFGDAASRARAAEAARAVVEANRGAADRVLQALAPLVPRGP